jgi:PAS domain S-box-containing protein
MLPNINEEVDLNLKKFTLYRRVWIPLLAVAIAIVVWYTNLDREDQFQLTVEELQWLKDHPTITVGPNPIFPPYEFYDDDGIYSGLSADLFYMIEKKLGVSIKTIRYDGRDARWQALFDGRIDILGSVKKTPLRQKDFLFSQPIAYSRDVIIVRSSITHSMTVDSLIGMRVAIPKNNAVYEELRNNYPGITIVPAGAGYASMYAVSFGTADAAILNMGAASYYIEKTGLNNLRVAGNYNERSELSFGYSRNQTVLKSIIDKTLRSLPLDQREQINKKWLGLQVQTYWWSFISWQWVVGMLSVFVLAVLIIMFWNRMLQRQVQVKTSTLNLEIIERKIAEKKFKEIITKNPMSIQILDKEGFTLEVNNSFKLLFGSVPPPGYSIFQDKQFAEQGVSEIFDKLRSGHVINFPDVCFNPKDSIPGLKDVAVWTRTIGFPLNDSDDKPEQFVLMHENITYRKQAEEKIREKDIQFRKLSANVSDLIFQFTRRPDGTYCVPIASEGIKNIFGCSPEDVLDDFTPIGRVIYPEDAERVISDIEYSAKHLSFFTCEFRVQIPGKPIQWILSRSTPEKLPDGSITWYGFNADITERKHAEELLKTNELKFRTIADFMYDWEYWKNEHEQIVYMSPSCERITGYTHNEFTSDPKLVEKIIYPEDSAFMLQHFIKVHSIDLRKISNEEEFRIVHKNGSIRVIHHICRPIFDENKKYLGRRVSNRDITERKITEQAFRQAQKLESIGTLAGGIAHDFNNLMNAVLGQAGLALQKLPKESPAVDHITKAIKASERVADLTKQLLAYSGKGKFIIDKIDLNTLVKENVQILEVSIPKTTKLQYELGSPSPHIKGDISQIQQVVMNMIINAGEAMDPNPGTIILRTKSIEIAQETDAYSKYTGVPLTIGKYALMQVKDSGSGINEETLSRIFDPFFTTKFTGRGLGLAAVLGIIKGHKGGIRIESEVGKGTMFEIVFPLIDSFKTTEESEKGKLSLVNGEGKTILVIDDEASIIELLEDVLPEANFKVISALDPLKGIEIYRRDHKNISLVVLDYSMPHMDGMATFEELLKINKDVKVLLCSGYSEEETLSVFGIDRPTGYFQKPYKPETLLQRLAELVSKGS